MVKIRGSTERSIGIYIFARFSARFSLGKPSHCKRGITDRSDLRSTFAIIVLSGQAELGQDFLVRNDLSARVGGACLCNVAGLFFAHRLVINRGVRQGNRDGIEHGFEQSDDGGDLAGGQTVDEFVCLLLRVGCRGWHREILLSNPEPRRGIYQSWIGELVVSKNALPYLAERAESQFGVRELSREIKGQYSIINRISDEMQDAIMQVRMMAVSFVFQRFPRLVRDISRKLGKQVQLVLEGDQTEADKNIIESLADPLIHIVRNSLDHGLETPEVRLAAGKPATGKLTIRAAQEVDRVVIEISDDGKGIDPAAIKQKAYEKGIIDEATMERIGDQEAINLIFAAGLSTAKVVSDLSGRGVGMDVVRSAVEKINGSVVLQSEVGKGTTIRISLPLSMAVTQVMIVESDGQLFGVPMDHVIETVRIPRSAIHAIKQSQTAILRGRIVPLRSLNALLGIAAIPKANPDDELAVLLVQAGSAELGLLVDGFHEASGVIQKPLNGFLSNLSAYSGSALMGDGSVLMILNIREIV